MEAGKPFRAEDWWIGKASQLVGLVYLFTIAFSVSFHSFPVWAISSLITIIGFASFGYMVNDYFDQEKDALVGKKNFMLGKSVLRKFAYSFVSLFLIFFPWYFLPCDLVSVLLIALQILTYFVYSVPFIRLKEKGILGIIADALYAHGIPSLLAAYTYTLIAGRSPDWVFLSLLFCWQFCTGVRNVVLHQINDLESDRKSGTDTFISRRGQFFISVFFISLKAAELLFLVALLASAALGNPLLYFSIVAIGIALAINFLLKETNGYRQYFPNILYEQWLPYSFIAILAFTDYRFLVLFPIQALLFSSNFLLAIAHNVSLFYRLHLHMRIVKSIHFVFNMLKLSINWSIYLAFRLFGIDLKKENTDAKGFIVKKINRKK